MVKECHKSFNQNTRGRDLIVGDIHGCFAVLEQALKAASFAPEDDRLFAVGDVVNRGPECAEASKWLDYPWFHSVQGNHDHMMINSSSRRKEDRKPWLQAMDDSDIAYLERQCAALPYTIDIETPDGLIGIVHAEVKEKTDWQTFVKGLQDPKSGHDDWALWDSERIYNQDTTPVEGVSRVYCGHVVQHFTPTKLGNVFYIDTGAYRRQLAPHMDMFSLTLTSATASEKALLTRRPSPHGYTLRL